MTPANKTDQIKNQFTGKENDKNNRRNFLVPNWWDPDFCCSYFSVIFYVHYNVIIYCGMFGMLLFVIDLVWVGDKIECFKRGREIREEKMTDSPKALAKGGSKSLMENLLGLLRIRVKRGVNLAVRDVRSSDPYVVIKMGKQVYYVSSSSSSFIFFLQFCDFSVYLAFPRLFPTKRFFLSI